MLRLDVTSLVWAFFRPEEKEDYMEVRKEDQRDPDEKVVEIEIERLRDFKNTGRQSDERVTGIHQEIWDS